MFTGLIQSIGTVVGVEPTASGIRLRIDPGGLGGPIGAGESVCVSGVCLTSVGDAGPGEVLAFDAIPETCRRSILGGCTAGTRVNLERSATPETLMGGHVVQGHVDAMGRVACVVTEGEYRIAIQAPPELMPCVVPKGSIAVDGVSMTVASVDPGERVFEIAVIPTTLELTTLSDLREGDACNLESDILARTIVHWMRHYAPGGPVPGDAAR